LHLRLSRAKGYPVVIALHSTSSTMTAMLRVAVVLVLSAAIAGAVPPRCSGGAGSCPAEEGPSPGMAMIQAHLPATKDVPAAAEPLLASLLNVAAEDEDSSKTAMAPLKGRLETLETEMAELQKRVGVLQGEVGIAGASAGAPEAALVAGHEKRIISTPEAPMAKTEAAGFRPEAAVARTAAFARPVAAAARPVASLARSAAAGASGAEEELDMDDDAGVDGDESIEAPLPSFHGDQRSASLLDQGPATLKARVAGDESAMATLKSEISALENQVSGNAFVTGSSLLAQGSAGSGSSLKSRIVGLEDDADSCRSRVAALEHMVMGGA